MIRIAHCISDTNFGGAGRVLLHYCKEQDRKHFELTGEGFMARALCHEIDHLDGVIYVDKMDHEIFADDEDEEE